MKNTGIISLALCSALTILIIIEKLNSPKAHKIGVVQMNTLVSEYKGMKEATRTYALKLDKWNKQTDSLEKLLKKMYNRIKSDSIAKNQIQMKRDISTFLSFKKAYAEYTGGLQDQAAKEDRQMTLGIINQVNESIKLYAKEKGYDVVLCNSDQQTVGYAKEQIDITNKVLEFANNNYEGIN